MKQAVTVVDTVMGTGKTTWVMLRTKESQKRTVIVVPRITEVERYQKGLKEMDGVVALIDLEEDKRTKTERFIEALEDAQVIITTHQLFENHLTLDTFEQIRQGEWSLVFDEVPTVFEQTKLVSGTVIDGFIAKDIMQEERLNERVSRLTVNPLTYQGYHSLPASEASPNEKRMLKEATKKDLLIVKQEDTTRGFPTFSLREERLDAFDCVTILTYPFKGSDLDCWLQIKKYPVEHYELIRHDKTNSLKDFSLVEFSGKYSGKQFAHLIELIKDSPQRGKDKPYGDQHNAFSANQMRKMESGDSSLDSAKATLRREFRNDRDKHRRIDSKCFMYTCLDEAKHLWQDRARKLNSDFISEENHVVFNTVGTNDYSHKTNLAFLHNVYQFPEIDRLVKAFDIECDNEQYALYTLIQWIWRSAIREGEKIRLYIPSRRMREILTKWLSE